ncbi:MAG: MaoC family dehydratase N-terminal domain-containing protein [Deltaproteobacteria bacterium]|nr:MaoC family dehydratase N-terminal domain-containing protein [Deltaproteobacteria bacterium]
MACDLQTVGKKLGPVTLEYNWKDVALYAISLGAGRDDLGYLLDPAPKVLPTYGVIPTFDPVFDLLKATGGDLVTLLHSSQRTEIIKPFPHEGKMTTEAVIRGIYDMKIGAAVVIDTQTSVDGEPTAKTIWTLLLRGEGGFGGERPPARLKTKAPADQAPDFSVEVPTSGSQALLYRLNGDINPIHADPKVAQAAGFDRPILHGLCTYGIAGRVALKEMAGDDPARFKALECLFAKPVMPGDTLVVEGYKIAAGQAALTVTVKETGVRAIANCLFEYAE